MLTFDEARARAQSQIEVLAREVPGRELTILEDRVLDRARGWAFPYNTTRFLETHNPLDGVVGNGPVFVDKNDGSVHVVPSGGYLAWLDAYDLTGAPPPAARRMKWVGSGPAPRFPTPPRKHNG